MNNKYFMGVGVVYAPHAQMLLWLSCVCKSKVQDSSGGVGVGGACVVGELLITIVYKR